VKHLRVNLIFIGLCIGISAGLFLGWVMYPRFSSIATPKELHSIYKEKYVVMIAAAYGRDGDLERAKSRLLDLGDQNIIDLVTAQAQRWAAVESSEFDVKVLSDLAIALNGESLQIDLQLDIVPTIQSSLITLPTSTLYPTIANSNDVSNVVQKNEYKLIENIVICDDELSEALLQINVINQDGRPLPGIKVSIEWSTGSDIFVTGLNPNMGIGYADYVMKPDNVYMLQIENSTEVIYGISSEDCRVGNGPEFDGSVLLTYQQGG
tara:strand:+ start:6559 stop:7353 length:795 start_codon:yes stop_codon:yes gene_type:complete